MRPTDAPILPDKPLQRRPRRHPPFLRRQGASTLRKFASGSKAPTGASLPVLVAFDAEHAACADLAHAIVLATGWPSWGAGAQGASAPHPHPAGGTAAMHRSRVILVACVDHGRVAPALRRWLRACANEPAAPHRVRLQVVLSGGPTGLVRAVDEIENLSGWTCEDVIVMSPLEQTDPNIGAQLLHRLDGTPSTREAGEGDTLPLGYELLVDGPDNQPGKF